MLEQVSVPLASSFYDDGIGRFLVSPGFGGFAALLAALLAYWISREKAVAEHEDARQERWWEALTWVYDRATAERTEARLPSALALDLFDRLVDQSQTELETQTALGLLELMFADAREQD